MMALWFFILLIVGLLLLWLARQGMARSGLPQGRLIYSDTGGWKQPERPLYSNEFLLTGKPDYLVVDGKDVIPVEVKSSRAPAQPYLSHVLQLAAYCLLVEEHYRRRPPYGIIKYGDSAFEVDYTPQLERDLLLTLDEMRADLAEGNALRNHDDAHRCRVCGYRQHCDEWLE
jgi:CRISPR-associated exonuclease Cas4